VVKTTTPPSPQIYFPAFLVIVKSWLGGEGLLGCKLNSSSSTDLMTKLQALKVAFIEGLMRVSKNSQKKEKQPPTQEAFENS
jgi:hypothetical protein